MEKPRRTEFKTTINVSCIMLKHRYYLKKENNSLAVKKNNANDRELLGDTVKLSGLKSCKHNVFSMKIFWHAVFLRNVL